MPIKNYTTKIPASKTVQRIQTLLAQSGARRVMIEYDAEGNPDTVAFEIEYLPGECLRFLLQANAGGCLQALEDDPGSLPDRLINEIHARRVAWRIVLNWIEAQLAMIEAEQASMARLLLGYAMTPDRRTVFDVIVEGEGRKLLAQHL